MGQSPYSELQDDVACQNDCRMPVFPVTMAEIRVCVLPLNSAAGPDGFTARSLRAVPAVVLLLILVK